MICSVLRVKEKERNIFVLGRLGQSLKCGSKIFPVLGIFQNSGGNDIFMMTSRKKLRKHIPYLIFMNVKFDVLLSEMETRNCLELSQQYSQVNA